MWYVKADGDKWALAEQNESGERICSYPDWSFISLFKLAIALNYKQWAERNPELAEIWPPK